MSTETPKRRIWIGFDLGGTKMMAVVFDDKLQVLAKKRRKTRGNAGEQVSLERLAETISQALTEAGVTEEEITGIGAGVPGPLDLQKVSFWKLRIWVGRMWTCRISCQSDSSVRL